MKQGQLPQALEKADAYISSKPKDAQGRFLKGLILTDMGRPTDAIGVFSKLTEDFPELPEPYNNLAVLYAQQKQYDKARTALEMAIRTHPSYSIAHENLGDVYAKMASQAYDKALQIDSSNTATQTKLSMIKELISTSSKPGVKPVAPAQTAAPIAPITARPAAEPVKSTAPEQASKPAATSVVAAAVTPAVVTKQPENAAAQVSATKPESKKTNEPVPTSNAGETEVTKAIQNWADAWERKDVKAYLAFYAKDFQTPKGMGRKDWESERHQRIDKPGKLQVNVEDIRVSVDGEKATAKFKQRYESSSLKSSTGKTITLIKSGGKWLIQQERVG